ncbi:glycoside hydrolase [Geomonas sp. RF6]|uniref:glycoside hydrolase family 57 protein n=1 Tax=Geomonas sp. RF6 TaxID=2897342 RepID=UPI001E4BBFFB|nr:glycoside hydrolase family 57 protein [Geomonas sp. RF6]UFS72742.1 glycoside hydrolase [Geomonas sp. RF6]
MADPLYVSFLWHMHQPYYKDPVRGEYLLPWTYLHAVKDYYDMPCIVESVPGAKAVFNLVPSLLLQIAEYAAGEAKDPFLIRGAMPPADMSEEERLFVLENFFSANRQRMIEPYPRYLELYCLAGDGAGRGARERLRALRDQDLLDLQVWFFLAWTGEAARRRYPEIRELVRKGKNFSEGDKELLFDRQRQLLSEIIPLYRRLHEEGKIEISVSPFFHPILPLLCDMRSARVAMPKVRLPSRRFEHPEDARQQVSSGIALFRETFGFSPAGMWPSEGSVSDAALGVMRECGIRWGASDEGVLAHSLQGGLGKDREALYHPYSYQDGALSLFFRDHALSDLIGFTYSQWDTERAVADFVSRVREVRQRLPGSTVAPVILDGENAWEYFPENGRPFLTRLYQSVAATPGLELATFSEVLERVPARRHLGSVHPGSWINANYGIWVGHPEENLAWDLVEEAREAARQHAPEVAGVLAGGSSESVLAREVCRELFAAEGSDWFWWYGDDHFSAHSGIFDLLFRRHLMSVYRLLGLEVPHALFEPIKKHTPAGLVREPAALITPQITGIVADYFEWLAAGLFDLTKQFSAMHAGESVLQSFFYGFDEHDLFFRIDGVQSLDRTFREGDILSLYLIHGREFRLDMEVGAHEGELLVKGENGWSGCGSRCRYRIARIAEAAVSVQALALSPGDKLFGYLTLTREREELGRWPVDTPLPLKYAGPELETETWVI